MVRKWGTAILAAALIASSSTAALAQGSQAVPSAQQGALAPGGSAGVEKAEFLGHHGLVILFGVGVLAGAAYLAFGHNGHGHPSATTTATP